MATIKKFSDVTGQAIELGALTPMRNEEFAARWPGVKGIRADGYTKWVAKPIVGEAAAADSAGADSADFLPVTRMIEMKRYPSLHQCNSKCLNGKHNGICECKCGGKNHGRGLFTGLMPVPAQRPTHASAAIAPV